MNPGEEVEMETEEEPAAVAATVPFQLQLDKPIPSQIKIAEWNPEKDLLAMVTEDSKILLHRFNWQRLWTVSPGKCISSLCWRPDGRTIAVGLEDGSIALHDVENGKLLRSIKSHNAAVVCLNWEEDAQPIGSEDSCISSYEDRTPRFFPPAPRIPRMPGLSSGDAGLTDDTEDSFGELSHNSHKRFNILCSGDKDGDICFSIFGIFPIGKINICNLAISTPSMDEDCAYRLMNAFLHKPAAEIIGFRIGELRGLSRWRARYHSVGLDKKLVDNATEKAGMFLVQVERFLRVLAILIHEFQNFFTWLMRCIKLLMSESTALASLPNSELIVTFLKFHYNCDPVSQLLEASEVNHDVEVDL